MLGWIMELVPTALAFLVIWGVIALAVLLALRAWNAVSRPNRRRRMRASS